MNLSRSAVAVLAVALLSGAAHPQQGAVTWPHTVTLTVVTATDQAVPGARVELWPSEQASGAWRYTPTVNGRYLTDVFEDPDPRPVPQPPTLTAETDENGRVRLELPSREAVFAATFSDGAASGLWYARAVEREEAVTVPLDRPGEIAGVVLAQDGQPVGGASVRFQDAHLPDPWEDGTSGRGEARCPRDVLTGADGRFVAPAERRFLGLARARTPEGWTETAFANSRGAGSPPIRLRVPGRFRIVGRCVDEQGRPFEGARVVAARALQAEHPAVTADAFGRFELLLVDPGHYVVTASHQNQPEQALDRTEAAEVSEEKPEATVALRFVRAASIRGRVQWPDGQPAAGVQITTRTPPGGLSVERAGPSLTPVSARTGEDGTFELRGLRPGSNVDLEAQWWGEVASHAGRGLIADRVLREIPAGSSDVRITFDDRARHGGRVLLRVLDEESGEPLDDAEVLVVRSWGRDYPAEVPVKPAPSVAGGAGGLLVIDGLRLSIRHALIVRAPGHDTAALGPVDVGEQPVQLDVALRPLGTVVVRIESPDTPPGEAVWLQVLDPQTAPLPKSGAQRRRTARADANGEVRVQSAAGETLWLQAWSGPLTSDVARVLPSAQEERTLTLRIAPQAAGALEVRVVDELGQAVAGAEVSLVRTAGVDASAKAVSGADGLARFPSLAPGLWFATCADPDRGFGTGAVAVGAGQHATLVLPTR